MIDFYVVAIGMSAGGLPALEELMKYLPDNPGAAFVIISHLPKDSKSQLDAIISRHTNLPVQWAESDDEIQKNHCYLLPTGKQMTLENKKLQVQDRMPDSGINRAIDIFFTSLAHDVQKLAIGIILSGTGEDGLEGVQAIEQYKGIVMVQQPESAMFSSMPWTIVSRDHPDFILVPKEIAQSLVTFLKVKPG